MELDTGFVTLVVGLLGVIVLTALIGVIVWMRRSVNVRIPAGALPRLQIALAPDDREAVVSQLREAAVARGEAQAVPVSLPERLRLGRVLWVDDDPDTSLSETIALHTLGTAVVKATHAEAALAYLSADRYTAVVFGIVPDSDLDAIAAFVEHVRVRQPGILILGYAAPGVVTDAAEFTLVRDPGELVAAVLAPLTVT